MMKRTGYSQRLLAVALVSFAGLVGVLRGQSKPPIVPPRPLKLFKPDCSVGKPCRGIHGVVVITVSVLTDGTVGDTTPKSGDDRLVPFAEEAARQCRFDPGTFNGKPMSMDYDLRYKF